MPAPQFVKVFNHDTSGGLFHSPQDALSKNPDNPDAKLFSVLNKLEDYRNHEGNFHFKLCYPEYPGIYGGHCNEWIQSSNPATEGTVSGFQGISIEFTKNGADQSWAGLGKSETNGTLIDNTGTNQYWWGAIGATVYYQSLNGDYTIPGPSVGGNGGHYGAHRVNLHVSVGDVAFKCR